MPRTYEERPFASTSPVGCDEALQHLRAGAVLKFLSLSQGFWLSGIDSGVGPDVALTVDCKLVKQLRKGKHIKQDHGGEVYAEPGEVDRLAAAAQSESQRCRQAVVDQTIDKLLGCDGNREAIQAVLESLDITRWA